MGLENKLFFNLKIIDIKVKLDIRNFIRISRVEIIRPGLVKSILKLIYKHWFDLITCNYSLCLNPNSLCFVEVVKYVWCCVFLIYFPLIHHFNIVSSLFISLFPQWFYIQRDRVQNRMAHCWLQWDKLSRIFFLVMKFFVKNNVCILWVPPYFNLTLNSILD